MEHLALAILPAAVERGIAFDIMSSLEHRGFSPCGSVLTVVSEEQAQRFYQEHEGKPFYDEIVKELRGRAFIAVFPFTENANAFLYALRGGRGVEQSTYHFNGSVLSPFCSVATASQKLVQVRLGDKFARIFLRLADHVGCKIGS